MNRLNMRCITIYDNILICLRDNRKFVNRVMDNSCFNIQMF